MIQESLLASTAHESAKSLDAQKNLFDLCYQNLFLAKQEESL